MQFDQESERPTIKSAQVVRHTLNEAYCQRNRETPRFSLGYWLDFLGVPECLAQEGSEYAASDDVKTAKFSGGRDL